MKRFILFFIPFIALIFFPRCKTDFDISAPYREIPVVYGLLNIADTVQWIRINKAFLGEGNALVLAQQPDSINYPDILNVSMEEYSGNTLIRTIIFQRDSGIIKEPGIFSTAPNILYRTGDRIDQKNNYKLIIYNRENGKTITAFTSVVDSLSISQPSANSVARINWTNPQNLLIKWTPEPEAFIYQAAVRFYYEEEKVSDTLDKELKYIDWLFPEIESRNTEVSVKRNEFYQFVARSVKPNSEVRRKIGKLDFIFSAGAKEFYTYYSVNRPATGVSQTIPEFTNIEGGRGVFSSRLNQYIKNKEMDQVSKDSLRYGSITRNLGFYSIP